MEGSDFLFDLISQLTGGVVTDVKTAISGMVLIGICLMALDYLKDILVVRWEGFSNSMSDAAQSRRLGYDVSSMSHNRRMAEKYRGTVEGDIYAYTYREELKEYHEKASRPSVNRDLSISGLSVEYDDHERIGYDGWIEHEDSIGKLEIDYDYKG